MVDHRDKCNCPVKAFCSVTSETVASTIHTSRHFCGGEACSNRASGICLGITLFILIM
jgi:hypothetical protein